MAASIAAPEGGGEKRLETHHLILAHALKSLAKFFTSPVRIRPVSSGFSARPQITSL
jgi:hypothetical protein